MILAHSNSTTHLLPENDQARRLGILTFHYVLNPGAVLQAYALSELLGAEIIDHRYASKQRAYKVSGTNEGTSTFIENRLRLSDFHCVSGNFAEHRSLRYLDAAYDAVVCGSDEVWKCSYSPIDRWRPCVRIAAQHPVNTLLNYALHQRDPYCTPFPNIYWPKTRIPLFAFATSVGQSKASEVPPRHRAMMADRLRGFSLIGVRDRQTREFINQIAPDVCSRVVQVPDPVFSLEVAQVKQCVDEAVVVKKLRENGATFNKPLAFVHFQAGRKLPEIISNFGFQEYDLVDLRRCNLNPLEWYVAIGMCNCGITDAMHALIVSLCQNIPCISIDHREKSRELREDFELPTTQPIAEYIERWPNSVPDQVSNCRRRTHDFAASIVNIVRSHPAQLYNASARGAC